MSYLVKLRKNLNMTQQEFGKLLGVNSRTVVRYEQKESKMDTKQLYMLMKNVPAFDVYSYLCDIYGDFTYNHIYKAIISKIPLDISSYGLLEDTECIKITIKKEKENDKN